MNSKLFQLHSLKSRVTLFTLGIFVISIWVLTAYASRMLRLDMQRLVGEQQFSTVSMVAGDLNDDVQARLEALGIVAASLTPAFAGGAAEIQKAIEARPIFVGLFNDGTFVVDVDGAEIVSIPASAARVGANYIDRDYIVAALKEGRSSVSKPVLGKMLKMPVIVMVVPIRDVQGKVIGALNGVTDLGKPNFLDRISKAATGRTSHFTVVSAQHRISVTSSDKNRVLMTLPPPGVNPYLDRNIAGYEGYDVVVNTLAGEELASIKRIPAAQWYLYTGMSTEEAFAPVRALQERFILGALLLTVVAGSLAWWMLNRQLTPMFATASKLTQMAESSESPQPLPITRQDEVGALIGSFNHLLLRMGQHREALQESEENLAITLNSIGDAVIATDPNGRVTRMNPTAERLTGWTIADAVGHPLMDVFRIVNATTRETVPDPVLRVVALGQVVDLANHTVLLAKGGLEYQIADSAAPIRNGAREIVGVVLVFSDVTERYRTELALLNSEQSYRSLLDNLSSGVVVHAPDTSILLSNPMAATLLGLTRDQLLGKTAMDPEWCFLDDDGTLMPTKDYPVNRVLDSGERLQNYVVGVRRSDRSEPTWMLCNAYPMHDANGNILQVVVTFTDITVRKQAELQIQTMAFTDALTGLPNRRLLLDRLVQALAAASRHGHQNALMFIDLDNFKTINDTLGHDIGDMLLRQIALRLNSCVRDGDTVARLGGDEFVVLLKVLSTNAQEAAANAQMVAAKILNALAEPYELEGQRHHSTASIGVTLFGGGQREEVEEPLKRAELAMYQAKTTGRNTLRFFEPDMRTVVAARAALEAELHEAVANDQFVLYYQGQGTGHDHMTGAEALVRWQHPKRGLVSPSEFIPIAETSGLILPLGRWVLKTACQQLANWATRPERAHLTMAVNVSARQFRHSDFVQDVLAILQATGANPQRLKLELTESMLVDNVENLITKMNALKAQGVGFSLDDFGTGYSSLSYLKRLPIDQLKIDQGFITDILTDPGDAAIAKTVVALADSLGLSVIAEGVETEAQQEFLAALGCNNYQGYLFCRPLPIQEFEAFAGRV